MTSPNDVHRLRREGLSIRQIAARLGLSRTKVHRWVSRPPDFDGDGDGLALDDEENLTPPFTFVGLETEPRPGKPVRGGERYVDRCGVSFNALDLYRWGQDDDPDRRRQCREVAAGLHRQIAASGLVSVHPGDGYWYYARAEWLGPDYEIEPADDGVVPCYRRRR